MKEWAIGLITLYILTKVFKQSILIDGLIHWIVFVGALPYGFGLFIFEVFK